MASEDAKRDSNHVTTMLAYDDTNGEVKRVKVDPKTGGIIVSSSTTSDLSVDAYYKKKYYTNAGAVTDGVVWSPAAGTRWHITDIYVQTSAAATITLEDDLTAGDSVIWKGEFAANSGWSKSCNTPLFSGEDAADLLVTTSAGNVYITVVGYEL